MKTKSLVQLSAFWICFLLVWWIGYKTGLRPKACKHPGRLDQIDFKQTWRMIVQLGEEATLDIGVCKGCGVITDTKASGVNWFGHWLGPPPIVPTRSLRSTLPQI